MIKPALTVAAAVVFGLTACAPARHKTSGTEADLAALRGRLSEAEGEIAQLTQRLTLMQIIVDSHQRTLQDLGGEMAAGDMDLKAAPAVDIPETGTAPAADRTPVPVASGIEETAPVSETARVESSPGALDSGTAPPELEMTEPEMAETEQPPEAAAAPVSETVTETAASGPSPDSREAESTEPPETEEILSTPEPNPRYQAAMELFRRGDYETAGDLFEAFARQFPQNDLADNALYWSGECRYTRKDYTGALKQFRQVIENYPSGSKVPDALLKIGFTYLSLGDRESAVTYLKKVVAQYPFSTAGTKAEERLKELRE